MKKKYSFLSVAILASVTCAGALLIVGCAGSNPLAQTRDVFLVQKPGPVVTNNVAVYAPEDVIAPAVTNLESGVIAPAVAKPGATPISYVQVGVQTPGVWEDTPNVANAQAVANTVPVYGALASVSIGLLASLGKLWLNRKQKPIITSTFQTIEDFTTALNSSGDPKGVALAAKLKSMLAGAHDYAKVMPQVQELINAYTGHSGSVAEVAAIAKS